MNSVSEIVVSIVCAILICISATVGNTIVIFVFVRRKDVLTTSNYLFASLCFGNLSVGFCYPVQCLVNLGVLSSRTVCLPFLYCLLVLGYAIIWSLLALTLERYLTITCPLAACRVISEKRVIATILLIYLFSVICGAVVPVLLSISAPPTEEKNSCRFIDLVPSSHYRFFLLANRFVSVLVFVIIYGRIFVVMRRHMRAIAVQIRPAPQAAASDQTYEESSVSNSLEVRHYMSRWKREVRPTILLFVMVLYHSLSWIPQAVAIDDAEGNFATLTITHLFTYSSCAINPVLYGYSNQKFRRALASVLVPQNGRENN